MHTPEEIFLSLFLMDNLESFLINVGWYTFKVQAFSFSKKEKEKEKEKKKYKPSINSTALIAYLEDMQVTIAKALEHFNSTRHIILYDEDLIMNLTVRTCW